MIPTCYLAGTIYDFEERKQRIRKYLAKIKPVNDAA